MTPDQPLIGIGHDLYVAIDKTDFTGLERRVMSAVYYMTVSAGKTKAKISAEDIRYYLGADDKLRTDRIVQAITALIARGVLYRQELSTGEQLLALQADFTRWDDKMSEPSINTGTSLKSLSTNNHLKMGSDKMSPTDMSPPVRLMAHMQERGGFQLPTGKWRGEQKQAKQLYKWAIVHTKSGEDAYNLITDYIDQINQDDWIRQNVRMQFTYASSRLAAWAASIPRKPREVKEMEEATGRRWRYNVKNKQWEEVR